MERDLDYKKLNIYKKTKNTKLIYKIANVL